MKNTKDKFVMPKENTLHYLLIMKMLNSKKGVTFLDFVGTGITEQNIDGLIQDLHNGFYESDDEHHMKIYNEVKAITESAASKMPH